MSHMVLEEEVEQVKAEEKAKKPLKERCEDEDKLVHEQLSLAKAALAKKKLDAQNELQAA